MRLFYFILITISLPVLAKHTDINTLQKMITFKKANWIAKENNISKLSNVEKSFYLGANLNEKHNEFFINAPKSLIENNFPERLSWIDKDGKNYMSPITDQGRCGSCVAFAAIGTLEGQVNVTNNRPGLDLNFSEQHLWSCGSGACDRGWFVSAAARQLQKYGVADEACYPYLSGAIGEDFTCQEACHDSVSRSFRIANYTTASSWIADAPKIINALQHGPVMAAMMVYEDFITYSSGVYEHVLGESLGGHAIVIVGYDNIEKYWIVRNSWGTSWGENGYFRIKMNDISNVGRDAVSFQIEPFQGVSKISTPKFQEYIKGKYLFKLENTHANANSMGLVITNSLGESKFYAAEKKDNNYEVLIDTIEFEDGVYTAQAISDISEKNQSKADTSLPMQIFIINNPPEVNLKVLLPLNDETITGKITMSFAIDSRPILIHRLKIFIKNLETQEIKEIETTNIGKQVDVSWRTQFSPNGKYSIWTESKIFDKTFKSDEITVTTNN